MLQIKHVLLSPKVVEELEKSLGMNEDNAQHIIENMCDFVIHTITKSTTEVERQIAEQLEGKTRKFEISHRELIAGELPEVSPYQSKSFLMELIVDGERIIVEQLIISAKDTLSDEAIDLLGKYYKSRPEADLFIENTPNQSKIFIKGEQKQ